MSKFGTTPTNNNPEFGNNPAAAPKKCFYLFFIDLWWQGDSVSTDKLEHSSNPDGALPSFGGSIAKMCLCYEPLTALKLSNYLATQGYPPPPKVIGGVGLIDHVKGHTIKLSKLPCKCRGSHRRESDGYTFCGGKKEFDILGQGGQPLNMRDGFWITSTGDTRQFPSASKKDILQDILDTEMSITFPCCKRQAFSTGIGGTEIN